MSNRTVIRGRLANAERRLRVTPGEELRTEVDRLRTEYRTEALGEYIARVVDAAPPLTGEQRDRLAALLRGSA